MPGVDLTINEQAVQQLISESGEIGQRVKDITRRAANAARTRDRKSVV